MRIGFENSMTLDSASERGVEHPLIFRRGHEISGSENTRSAETIPRPLKEGGFHSRHGLRSWYVTCSLKNEIWRWSWCSCPPLHDGSGSQVCTPGLQFHPHHEA
jgi:hypothetical protein